jgi:hypothetical protein
MPTTARTGPHGLASHVPRTRRLAGWGGGGGSQDALDWPGGTRPRSPCTGCPSARAPSRCPGPGGAHGGAVRRIQTGYRLGGEPRAYPCGGMCPAVVHVLEAPYGALIAIYRLEAGFCSQAHARLMATAHQG